MPRPTTTLAAAVSLAFAAAMVGCEPSSSGSSADAAGHAHDDGHAHADGSTHSGHDHAEEHRHDHAEGDHDHAHGTDSGDRPGTLTLAGFVFAVPAGWTAEPPANQMRLAQLAAPAAGGEGGEAPVAAFSVAGGDIASNVTRWAGQFGLTDAPEPDTMTVAGTLVHMVSLEGEYRGMGMQPPQADHAMRAAIVELGGPRFLFVKMTGPADAVDAAAPAFDAMIRGMTAE